MSKTKQGLDVAAAVDDVAAVDFAGIVEYIRAENLSAADRIAHTIYETASKRYITR